MAEATAVSGIHGRGGEQHLQVVFSLHNDQSVRATSVLDEEREKHRRRCAPIKPARVFTYTLRHLESLRERGLILHIMLHTIGRMQGHALEFPACLPKPDSIWLSRLSHFPARPRRDPETCLSC